MKIIIDTNVFYYWSGLQRTKIDLQKIENALAKYSKVYLADLSLFELCLRYNDKKNLSFIVDFITNKKIKILKQDFQESSIYIAALKIILEDQLKIDRFCISLKEQYINNATDFSASILMHVTTALSEFLISSEYTSSFNKNLYYDNITSLLNWCKDELRGILKKLIIFPRDNTSSKIFINQFKNMVIALTKIILEIFDIIKNDKDLITEYLQKDIKKRTGDELSKFHLKANLKKQITQKEINSIYTDISYWASFEKYKNKYSLSTIGSYNQLLKFLSVYIRKMLSESKRTELNDMFDLVLCTFYPKYQIITFDKKFISILNEVNSKYTQFIINFINSVSS